MRIIITDNIQTDYIPYSDRNEVKTPHLATLIDYIERHIGWDDLKLIESQNGVDKIKGVSKALEYEIQIGPKNVTMHERGGVILMMNKEIFLSIYTSILPYYR